MKKDPKQIQLRKKLVKALREMCLDAPVPNMIRFKNQMEVPVGATYTHNSDSGRFTLTVVKEGTKVVGVDPVFRSAIFSENLIETKRNKPVPLWVKDDGRPVYFNRNEVHLSALPLEILEFVEKELQN